MSVRDQATAHFAPVARHLARLGARARILVADAEGGELLAREADEPAPPASVIKLPLVMALYAEAAAERLDLDERLPVGAPVDGSGVLGNLRDIPDASLRDLATLAVIVSDNTATNRLIERLGFDLVNAYLDAWGCPTTRLRRAMYDLDRKRAGLENVMTARETVRLLALLGRFLPRGAWLANKSGWDEGSAATPASSGSSGRSSSPPS